MTHNPPTAVSHTEFPWEARESEVFDAHGHELATCWSGPAQITRDERDANARLISAAPDLLYACEEFAAQAELWGISIRNSAALVCALEAIAKAKGEPSPIPPQTVGERGVW